jgi:transcriptional regulator
VARANPHWRSFDPPGMSLAIFHGPHAYISPSWYAGEMAAVPTWNYAVVHVYGKPQVISDPVQTREIIDRLIARYEPPAPAWLDRLTEERYDQLLRAIVAFETPIERIEGKFKFGQNRSEADQLGALHGLEESESAEAAALAALVRRHLTAAPPEHI